MFENNIGNENQMPGPQFDRNDVKNWLGSNYQKIVIGTIIVLLAIGGYFFYKSYRERQLALQPILQTATPTVSQSPSPTPTQTAPNQIAPTDPNVKGEKIQPTTRPTATQQNGKIVMKAAKGNGLTHLARQALKEYGKENSLNLKNEQKIYIEDYLQKHLDHSGSLRSGEEITFSSDLIKEAIDQAQQLTDRQINNLSKYVPLVPSL